MTETYKLTFLSIGTKNTTYKRRRYVEFFTGNSEKIFQTTIENNFAVCRSALGYKFLAEVF